MEWIVDGVLARWPGISVVIDGENSEKLEAPSLRLDSSRARRVLGWQQAWSLDRALDATVEWYRAFDAGDDVRNLALAQIEEYESDARA